MAGTGADSCPQTFTAHHTNTQVPGIIVRLSIVFSIVPLLTRVVGENPPRRTSLHDSMPPGGVQIARATLSYIRLTQAVLRQLQKRAANTLDLGWA